MGIPASILGSFLILPFFGFSINMISMFAFIVTLGIVVDDAIVVGENIFHYRQGGMPYLDAAIQGATEIAMPVTFSILTNVVAFIPLFFIPGFLGKIFRMIPAVVIAVLAISLVESLFVLPSHLGHLKHKKSTNKKSIFRLQENFSYAFSRFIEIHYGDFIKKTLKNRYVVLALAIAILICTIAYVKSDRMGMVMFPKSESNYAYVTVSLPYGSPEIKAQSILNRLVEGANRVIEKNGGEKLTRGVLARIDENVVSARIILTPPEQRPIGTQKVTDLWREEVGQLSGVESVSFQSDRGGPGHGKSLTVELSHRDADTLTRASEDLAEELSTFPNAKDIDDGSASGKLQYDFFMLPEGERLGFTASEVALKIRHALYGAEVQRLQRGRDEVKVIVRLPEIERNAEFTLEDMVIQSPSGVETPLSDIVRRESGRAYTSIIRRNGKRISSVEADIMPASETGLVVKELKAGILPKLAQKYPALSYSFEGRQADMKESIASLINGLMMSLIVIFCLLAIPLRSYLQPLLIMACIPFGIVGAFIGHLLLGYSLSVMSLFGVVALSGVVVNDSLVLIDCANKKKLGDMTPFEAIHSAGIQRFRPIMLTTITTFGGLAPMIFETSRQAKFLIPMAISLGFGILFATLITLVLVPVLYMILEDFKASVSR
jgi:multidrug efflux pump subunit AcrB